jgi:hypothetical protein
MKILSLFLLSSVLIFFSCNKQAGQGGTSIIQGKIVGQNHSGAKAEVTEIIFTNGSSVEHGDYWLLNSPSTDSYFYVWYDNPTWVSNGNPNLSGRTGIKVTFNYSDSNTEIANNTKDAILSTTNQYDISSLNDILVITNSIAGDTPDATDVTSPFDFNIVTQGQNSSLTEIEPVVGNKIYITYGKNEGYNDNTTTGPDGYFNFNNLTKGDYTIHYSTKDTVTGITNMQFLTTRINKNKSVNDLGEINILY